MGQGGHGSAAAIDRCKTVTSPSSTLKQKELIKISPQWARFWTARIETRRLSGVRLSLPMQVPLNANSAAGLLPCSRAQIAASVGCARGRRCRERRQDRVFTSPEPLRPPLRERRLLLPSRGRIEPEREPPQEKARPRQVRGRALTV
jgi:hypothetical protein